MVTASALCGGGGPSNRDRDRRHSLAHPMRESVNAPTKQFPAPIREGGMNGRLVIVEEEDCDLNFGGQSDSRNLW